MKYFACAFLLFFLASLQPLRAADNSTAGADQTPDAIVDGEHDQPRAEASATMLDAVRAAWERPKITVEGAVTGPTDDTATSDVAKKLNQIVLPTVNFSGMEIGKVITTLGALSEEYDHSGLEPKGVNIVLLDPKGATPPVTVMLRNTSLKRLLDYVTASIGYHYEIEPDAVVVLPGGEHSTLETNFFPIARSTVLRLTGKNPNSETHPPHDPLAGKISVNSSGAQAGDGQAIRNFLQLAGVDFDGVPGASLAFDGSQLIVTHTPRNLQRVRNILNHYRDLRQVQIEAKFMEVQQGALDELGVQWNVATQAARAGSPSQSVYTTGGGITRTLGDAFKNATTTQQISISGGGQPAGGLNLPAVAPTLPGGAMLGTGAGPIASLAGTIGEFDVNAVIRALAQKSGTELLSAPKLTVLSGNQATITVAQELRYPQSYGQIQSQVGTGSNSGGGSAGVSITSGTPQEFATRNVGVELKVMPTVEEDNHSISLDLNPKVTEFEGFVEYGGPSIAISGGTTVTVPPGFYQPIFAVREMTTKVTIWDGATLVMGGLTREEVKKVNDKVPVLGSLPLIGRLFRSQGESSQKRNLLIFVTANLVNPGGAPTKSNAEDAAVAGRMK
jgi:general secretion pathway protein D